MEFGENEKEMRKEMASSSAEMLDISGFKDFSGYEPKTSIKIGVKNFIDCYKEYYKVNL